MGRLLVRRLTQDKEQEKALFLMHFKQLIYCLETGLKYYAGTT